MKHSTTILTALLLLPVATAAHADTLKANLSAAEAKTGVNLAPVAEPSSSRVSGDTPLAAIDCSKLKPTKIQKGEWSAPDHTLRSERIDIYWGDKRSAEPWKDFPKDDPRYFDPREIMKTAETYWTQAVEKLQVYRGKNYVPRDRLRIVIRSTWKTWRGKPTDGKHKAIGGGIMEGEGEQQRLIGGHAILSPGRTAMNKYVVMHELTHALQTYAKWDRHPVKNPGVRAWKTFGMSHESHAVFIPMLIGEAKNKVCKKALATKHLRPGLPRPYQNWAWMLFIAEKEGARFFCRVYEDHSADAVHPFELLKRRKKFNAKQLADYWFEHALRNVTGDYKLQNVKKTIDRMKKANKPLTVTMQPVADKPETFEVPAEFVPQRFGYNHILLNPVERKDGKSHKITVKLNGGPCEDESADWRIGFCVITADGKPRYTAPTAAGCTATVDHAADDESVYLVVMATPGTFRIYEKIDPADEDVLRYPYTVTIRGAQPR